MRTIQTRIIAAAVIITLASVVVFAQGTTSTGPAGQTTKGAVIKGKAPVNKNLLKVKLPKAQEATLKNGLHVVVLESKNKLPIFSMEMVVMSGGLSDLSDMRGLANATALLMREGTAKHNSRELAEQLDTIGATFNATSSVSSPTSSVSTSGLVENLDQILDIFTEVIRTPKFPTEE